MSVTDPAANNGPIASGRFGLLGYPLGHSLSPQIHQRLLASAGIAGRYELLPTPPAELSERLDQLLRDYDGFNVTIPFKQQILPVLDQIEPVAARIGSVNTVSCRASLTSLASRTGQARTAGYNTDLAGFLADAPPMAGRKVLVLGSGGVSRTLAFAAAGEGALRLRFLVRNPEKAQPLADSVRAAFPELPVDVTGNPDRACLDVDQPGSQPDTRWVLLNGTPAGMWPYTGEMPVPPALLDHVEAVYDTIYNPYATRLVLAARQRGIPARGGLGMLVRQALVAQQIWHPEAVFPVTIVQDILAELAQVVYQHSPLTLVLTGFMGSGKSRLGLELANRTGWPLVDLDQRIVESSGRTIPEIFAADGEAFFRNLECQHLAEVLQNPRCQILATGGGALLSGEAQAILRAQPVRVIYLDASLETIQKRVGDGRGRPMLSSGDTEAMARLLALRRPIYEKLADLTIVADRPLLEKTHLILDLLGLGGQSQ